MTILVFNDSLTPLVLRVVINRTIDLVFSNIYFTQYLWLFKWNFKCKCLFLPSQVPVTLKPGRILYAFVCIHHRDKNSTLHMAGAQKIVCLTWYAHMCQILFFVLDHTQRYKAREYISLPVWCCQVMWFWICTNVGSPWGSLYWLCGNPMVQSSRTIGRWCQVWQVRHQQGGGGQGGQI